MKDTRYPHLHALLPSDLAAKHCSGLNLEQPFERSSFERTGETLSDAGQDEQDKENVELFHFDKISDFKQIWKRVNEENLVVVTREERWSLLWKGYHFYINLPVEQVLGRNVRIVAPDSNLRLFETAYMFWGPDSTSLYPTFEKEQRKAWQCQVKDSEKRLSKRRLSFQLKIFIRWIWSQMIFI